MHPLPSQLLHAGVEEKRQPLDGSIMSVLAPSGPRTDSDEPAMHTQREQTTRWRTIALMGVVVAACALPVLGIIAYVTVHNDRFKESTAVGIQDGVPVVLHADCGSPAPIGRLEIREVPPGWKYPTDQDPLVFQAAATGSGASEVALSPAVPGYEILTAHPLTADQRYYVANLWGPVKNELATASEFSLADLHEGMAHSPEGNRADVRIDDWYASTACHQH